tara:strand:+ start:3306 stop:3458 length:153 start_codon:yes stop_codon:yes gene_type:complete
MENDQNIKYRFGWNLYSEAWNGRLAMIGLLIGILTEFLSGQSIISQLGLR